MSFADKLYYISNKFTNKAATQLNNYDLFSVYSLKMQKWKENCNFNAQKTIIRIQYYDFVANQIPIHGQNSDIQTLNRDNYELKSFCFSLVNSFNRLVAIFSGQKQPLDSQRNLIRGKSTVTAVRGARKFLNVFSHCNNKLAVNIKTAAKFNL